MRRKRPSTATVIALVALVVALSGTAIAASRYIITSTSQIKPSVLRELRASSAHAAEVKLAATGAHAVRTRIRSVGSVGSATEPTWTADPLNGAAWTQHIEELNGLVGQINVTAPTQAECGLGDQKGGQGPGTLLVELLLDGSRVGVYGWVANGQTETRALQSALIGFGWIFEPAAIQSHTLTVRLQDDCGINGGNSGSHFTVNSVAVDVVGLK
jgi:hypothetical protein